MNKRIWSEMAHGKNLYPDVFESMVYPVIIMDAEKSSVIINHAAAEIFLARSLPDCLYCHESAALDGFPWISGELKEIISHVFADETIERELLTNRGTRYFRIITKRLTNSSQEPSEWVVIMTDVSDLMVSRSALPEAAVNLERRVADRTEQLEAVNEQLRVDSIERKQIESALLLSEERFRRLVDSVTDYI
jgi:PAS domain-containing protein